MKPIPVVFHIGPLQIHTYGIGLAITFWFAYRYFAKRLRDNGYPDQWLGTAFVWIIVAAILGARIVHVVANWGFYSAHPIEIPAIWHGGLTSFGGLALGLPVGLYYVRRKCPTLKLGRALDLVAPVLVSAWALGRLLGPQLMVNGGGRATSAWFGMYYAGDELGRRLPVPIFQAVECFVIFLVVLQVEKWCHKRGNQPVGLVMAAAAALYGLSRFVDERFWLTQDNGTDAVEIASLAFVGAGLLFMAFLVVRSRRRGALASVSESEGPGGPEDSGDPGGEAAGDEVAAPATTDGTVASEETVAADGI